MVKVLNIISDTNIGGAGRVLLNYLKYCDRAAFESSVCLPEGSLLTEPLRDAGASVYELKISADKSFDLKDIKKIKDLIQRLGPDIVHTHGSLSGRIAGKACGKTVVYTRHSVFPVPRRMKSGPMRLFNKLVSERFADRIIAVSPAARENLTDVGIREDLIDVVMNGVEPITRKPEEECRQLRARLGIGDGDFVCGILARLEPYKGHMIILDAAKALMSEGRRFKVLIAGAGAFEAEVRNKAADLGLLDCVQFLGFVGDVSSLLSILDVQLNASYGTEASSLSLLEGMSIGLPAIVSDYGGNPFVIAHEKNGLVFKSLDSGGLADCIRRLMDAPELRRKTSAGAVKIFNESFTGRNFAANIERVYSKTLKGDHNGK